MNRADQERFIDEADQRQTDRISRWQKDPTIIAALTTHHRGDIMSKVEEVSLTKQEQIAFDIIEKHLPIGTKIDFEDPEFSAAVKACCEEIEARFTILGGTISYVENYSGNAEKLDLITEGLAMDALNSLIEDALKQEASRRLPQTTTEEIL